MDRRRVLAALATAPFAGCAGPTSGSNGGRTTDRDRGGDVVVSDGATGYTHLRPDGNPVVAGTGAIPGTEPTDVPLDTTPAWLVAAPLRDGSLWVAVGETGRTRAFRVRGDGVDGIAVTPDRLPPGTPPLLSAADGAPALVVPPEGASTATHPVALDDERLVFVAGNGDLVLWEDDGAVDRLPIDALPDARIVRDGSRIAVLANATDRYGHGALGDSIEAGSVALIDAGEFAVIRLIDVPGDAVVEGIAPILADVTGDGTTDVIVTVSDADRGARLVAYRTDGTRIAAGPAIGTGNRWRHQLAVAPFGPDRGRELAAVRTPHIGGRVEFYRRRGRELGIVATLDGYSTHDLGSRNLDGGLAGDLDGDGRTELLVPTGDRTTLAGVRRTDGGATEAWSLPVDGRIRTNLAAVDHDGRIAVGVGRADGVRIWR